MIPLVEQDTPSLIALLQETALFLWKGWPRDVELASITEDSKRFVVRGTCPHCTHKAAFPSVTSIYENKLDNGHVNRLIAGARCAACNQYILVILHWGWGMNNHEPSGWYYESHYPLGKPNDNVDESIPEGPRFDFMEAIRCRWVKAYNATIEMCRRCLESSCIELGADPQKLGTLNQMIEWVHKQGKITSHLAEMAHKIKLGGNRAAHPSDRTLTPQDADAVLQFTSSYLHNVYVMPAELAKFNFDKPDTKGAQNP
jgi:Zn ribbon nucleic-acid-binding protein